MKKYQYFTLSLFVFIPLVSEAAETIQTLLKGFAELLNTTIVPFLFGIAFLFFVINVIRYFIIGGSNEDSRDKAKSLAIYGVAAFVFLAIFWGVINLLVGATGLGNKEAPCSDYMKKMGGCTSNTYRSEGQNYPPSTNNPNYSNEGNNYNPINNNPNYSNEGNNYNPINNDPNYSHEGNNYPTPITEPTNPSPTESGFVPYGAPPEPIYYNGGN